MSPRLALLVNPAARGGRALRLLEPVVRRLRMGGADVSVIAGAGPADALERACACVAERPDALVAFGGDGLVHLAVQAVTGTDVPLGIIPVGTGNDVAAALGVPCGDPMAAARTVLRMRTRPVDVARAVTGQGEELFASVLCCGFDARVNERANRLTWPSGRARYVRAVVEELRAFRPVPFRVTLDGEEVLERDAVLVAVGNTRSYGGGMRICPDARPDDGLLDVVVAGALGVGEFLRVFPGVYRGTHVAHPSVTVRRARHVRLEADGVPVYADGERLGSGPVTCAAVPGELQVIA
ncbi:diacylglycerol/lipid kinase family protein [Nonomuraea rhodomycinica]|uniref:YegS/Rv2252/BmrU family lipid kinase n=1 Tax=Nonomuraea rhodomycinica TaxID=1712872 RepID=A0A7Y6MBK1_9ACTN|nr:YegS/Rv2252/BmrU family lipid kinase [Nonomuraea rhodomycinica]NUW41777.1 YegS/Rv2252/BmrU family lipid kinase [Nonomuraea rhodomycinica]